jgi:DNA ligase-1
MPEVLVADVVATSERVAATLSRSAKIAALAELLRRMADEEVEPAVAVLSGEPGQSPIGERDPQPDQLAAHRPP